MPSIKALGLLVSEKNTFKDLIMDENWVFRGAHVSPAQDLLEKEE